MNLVNEGCKHKKIYSGSFWATADPLYNWICELCGETGSDSLKGDEKIFDPENFAAICHKFYPSDKFWG